MCIRDSHRELRVSVNISCDMRKNLIDVYKRQGLHAVTFQLAVKRGDADAQQAGGLGLVAFRVFEYPKDCLLYTSRCV